MKHLFLLAALLGGFALQPALVFGADEIKPVAIVAGEGYDELMSDIGLVGRLTDNPTLDQQIDGMIKFFTQGKGVTGLDTKRAWGLVVNTDGVEFKPVVFLPVTNLKQLLASLGPLIGEAKLNGEVYEIRKNNQSLFLKQDGQWAFAAQSADALIDVPKDPGSLIDSLAKTYDLAVMVKVQNIPEVYRELAVGQLKIGIESGVSRKEDESQQAFDSRKKMVQDQVDEMVDAINQTDTLLVGWKLDSKSVSTFLDVKVTATAGSDLAKQIGQQATLKSSFTGFLLPDAAVTATGSRLIPANKQETVSNQLDVLKANLKNEIDDSDDIQDDDKALAKQISGEMFDVMRKTVASGKLDGGLTVTLDDKLSAVVGFYVADPAAFEASYKKLMTALEKKGVGIQLPKWDAAKIAGVRFSTVELPLGGNQDAADILGDSPVLGVGIGPQAVYVSIGQSGKGKDGLDLARKVLAKAPTAEPAVPFQADADLGQILGFAAEQTDSKQLDKLADFAKKSDGKDHIRLREIPEGASVTYRLELDEAVLEVIGKASKEKDANRGR